MIHPPKKTKVWLKIPSDVTELRTTSKQSVRGRISNELQQRYLDFNERQKKIDKDFYELRLFAACDTLWKWRFVHGEVSLHQYLIKEAETFNK